MRPNKVKTFFAEKKPLAVGWMGTPDTFMVETMAKQTARTVGSQVGRQILRGVLGGIFGGRK